MESNKVRVAVIDLYNNEENQGLRCIKDLLIQSNGLYNNIPVDYKFFDTRYSGSAPDSSYDIYISSGGPGSPWDGEGTKWESKYFSLMDAVWGHNQKSGNKKHAFFICHSFQIMARYFKIADVIARNSKSFGVMPVHKTADGEKDFLLEGLAEPFYGADFREWQVVNPDKKIFDELGAKTLCLEKERPHIPLERAMMAIRINNEFVGTQFHPEADAASMQHHLFQPERKEHVISKYGEGKYNEMLDLLDRPDGMLMTQKTVLPNFLKHAIGELRPVNN